MTLSEYAIRFSELARHAPILVPTITERVHRLIEGLDYDIKICMAQELQTDTPFQQVVEITRKIEGVLGEERESKMAKMSRKPGGFSEFYSSARTYYSRGSSSRPTQSAHQITQSAQTQFEQSRSQRGCYECGDIRNIMRDCPRLGRGGFLQSTPATSFIPVNTPRAQSIRGGEHAGSGRLRGGGLTR
ncbi:uncharacterized protein [Nicotiana tomentosiformis]|uniref:uncharacterized protein n=1 Tax=Nicotiana tomentosiformis TaxID=4098 RepID=UPI00388C8511